MDMACAAPGRQMAKSVINIKTRQNFFAVIVTLLLLFPDYGEKTAARLSSYLTYPNTTDMLVYASDFKGLFILPYSDGFQAFSMMGSTPKIPGFTKAYCMAMI
jgi:hypothetical protein